MLVNEVQHGAERVIIERRGQPVAAIVRVTDLDQIEAARPSGFRQVGALALAGAWGDVDDAPIDALIADVYAAREASAGQGNRGV